MRSQAVFRPTHIRLRSKFAIERERPLIPVEHIPFETALAEIAQGFHQGIGHPLAASVFAHKEIFKPDPFLAGKSVERKPIDGHANDRPIKLGDQGLCWGIVAKQPGGKVLDA